MPGRKRREAQSPESPQFPKKRAKREANRDIAAEGRYERTFLAIKTLIDGETVELPALLSRISQYVKELQNLESTSSPRRRAGATPASGHAAGEAQAGRTAFIGQFTVYCLVLIFRMMYLSSNPSATIKNSLPNRILLPQRGCHVTVASCARFIHKFISTCVLGVRLSPKHGRKLLLSPAWLCQLHWLGNRLQLCKNIAGTTEALFPTLVILPAIVVLLLIPLLIFVSEKATEVLENKTKMAEIFQEDFELTAGYVVKLMSRSFSCAICRTHAQGSSVSWNCRSSVVRMLKRHRAFTEEKQIESQHVGIVLHRLGLRFV
jgi:hypothetical protein